MVHVSDVGVVVVYSMSAFQTKGGFCGMAQVLKVPTPPSGDSSIRSPSSPLRGDVGLRRGWALQVAVEEAQVEPTHIAQIWRTGFGLVLGDTGDGYSHTHRESHSEECTPSRQGGKLERGPAGRKCGYWTEEETGTVVDADNSSSRNDTHPGPHDNAYGLGEDLLHLHISAAWVALDGVELRNGALLGATSRRETCMRASTSQPAAHHSRE
jgi:hypothetical protein